DARVDGADEGGEGVAETFDMAAGEGRCSTARLAHERGVAEEDLVRSITVAQPQVVGRLAVPRARPGRAVDLPLQRVLPAGADLGDRERPTGAVREPEEDPGDGLGANVRDNRSHERARRERID